MRVPLTIDAGESYAQMSAIADLPKPVNQSQTRALAALTPEQKRRVWTEAAKAAVAGKLTAKSGKETRIKLGRAQPRSPTHRVNQAKPDQPLAPGVTAIPNSAQDRPIIGFLAI